MSDPRLEIQMLHDRVMVAPAQGDGERRSSGGIVIPATAQTPKKLVWGDVYGTGQHVRSVAVGDRVLYGQDDHFEVDVAGRSFVVLRERDLHAVASATTESTRSSSGTGLYL
ncbi:GroES family chaperonin [Actinomycetospora sp. NBC_00405]|uniref:GroES family chaperonin n=1 Tax=Actinomycetospora sp. NBC_00405 TaxID=2975952 RepID=UPI002E244DBE